MIPSIAPFRKQTNWLLALVVEAGAPALRWHARRQTGTGILSPKRWRRALILGNNHIGDALYRTCSLNALKAGLPECDFYYLAAASSADILAGNPFLKAVLPWARSDSRLDLAPEHVKKLKNLCFDAALCTNSIRYWPELLLAIRLGIPARAGYTYKGFSGWVTHPIPISYPRPFPLYFRNYVASLTGQVLSGPLKPEIHLSSSACAEADAVWRRMRLDQFHPVIAFFMTSRQNTATWPLDRYLTLFEMIERNYSACIILMGGREDKSFLDSAAARSNGGLEVCAGELSLQGVASFLKRCSLVIAKDAGPRHIANAVGTRALFFRSTSFSEVEAGAYCDTETDLTPPGEFLARRRQEELLAQVTPEMVFQRIAQALGGCK